MHDSNRGRRVQACLGVEAAGGSRNSLWVFFQVILLGIPTRRPPKPPPRRGQVTQSMTQASRSSGLLFFCAEGVGLKGGPYVYQMKP